MHLGTFLMEPTAWPFTSGTIGGTSVDLGPTPTLYKVALQWLREDRDRRRALEVQGRKRRGARIETVSISFAGERCMQATSSGHVGVIVPGSNSGLTACSFAKLRSQAIQRRSTRSKRAPAKLRVPFAEFI